MCYKHVFGRFIAITDLNSFDADNINGFINFSLPLLLILRLRNPKQVRPTSKQIKRICDARELLGWTKCNNLLPVSVRSS